ncbi:MAG TPA: flagellar protein FhlB [Gammaproteobacteria bacterium]|nr:flagellar protein FhlB [Gammaproteobacteria bacterium]
MKKRRDDRPVEGERDIAVALRYDGQGAPRVTAKGGGLTAERILELAEAHDVPLYPNPELAAVLARVPLGEEVPEALYRAVAEVIGFAYLVAGRVPEGFEPPED